MYRPREYWLSGQGAGDTEVEQWLVAMEAVALSALPFHVTREPAPR